MTSAPVTAPQPVTTRERRIEWAARVIYSTHGSGGSPTGSDYARAEAVVTRYEQDGPDALTEVFGDSDAVTFLHAAFDQAERVYRAAMLRLHEWDELVFGGYICTHCTPADADDPEQNVGFPCPPLRDAGVTEEMAAKIITDHYAEQERRVREAVRAAKTPLPELAGFREYDGVKVGYVGDEGDIVVLGWHANPREVLHAMDSLARDEAGIEGVYDDPERAPSASDLTRSWAINEGTGTGDEQWCLRWMTVPDGGPVQFVSCDDPGAFPITVLVM
jgi:hypothetical protein